MLAVAVILVVEQALHKKEEAQEDRLTVGTLEEEHCWGFGVGDAGATLVCSSIHLYIPPQARCNLCPDTRVLLVNKKFEPHNSHH